MNTPTKKLLFDMATACHEIISFTTGKTRDDYLKELQLRRAVERDFEILGEAINQLRSLDHSTFDRIPDASLIIGMRNRLIHAYSHVDDQLVWDAAIRDIPALLRAIRPLLDE